MMHTYSDCGGHTMNVEQTVAPEKARNLGRVESERNGCHKFLRKIGHIALFDVFVSPGQFGV